MPVDIEEIKEKGEPVSVMNKKVDVVELQKILSEQAYTAEELAQRFGVSKNTIKTKLYKLKKEGIPIKSYKLGKEVYYFID